MLMAKLVLAVGMSHGPMLALEPEKWFERVKDEKESSAPVINKLDGTFVTYAEYYEEIGDKYSHKISLENFTAQSEVCQAALDRIAADIETAKPDVIVIIGNDQRELFNPANSPAIAIYHGDEMATYKRNPEGMPNWRIAVSKAYGMDSVHRYPCKSSLATRLIKTLVSREFDIGACHSVPEPETLGFGHAYGFVAERVLNGKRVPIIPVLLNTMYPPNVPTSARCYKFGKALSEAIDEIPDDLRVVVVASGGLSHFICEEAFDRKILDAILCGDSEYLCSVPAENLTSGSSETRSWIALAGFVNRWENQWIEYVPVHRTPPGTGQGLAFGVWKNP
jgi:hypothetical protein